MYVLGMWVMFYIWLSSLYVGECYMCVFRAHVLYVCLPVLLMWVNVLAMCVCVLYTWINVIYMYVLCPWVNICVMYACVYSLCVSACYMCVCSVYVGEGQVWSESTLSRLVYLTGLRSSEPAGSGRLLFCSVAPAGLCASKIILLTFYKKLFYLFNYFILFI